MALKGWSTKSDLEAKFQVEKLIILMSPIAKRIQHGVQGLPAVNRESL